MKAFIRVFSGCGPDPELAHELARSHHLRLVGLERPPLPLTD